ncbi:MAG: hypothetical protein GY807_13805 [Gammaproteobacteria bacterium]|nr:hypothetical protein [Gammaproteobacteria bacterium]
MDSLRKRLICALLICSSLLLVNAIAVINGYAGELYCKMHMTCWSYTVQNPAPGSANKHAMGIKKGR